MTKVLLLAISFISQRLDCLALHLHHPGMTNPTISIEHFKTSAFAVRGTSLFSCSACAQECEVLAEHATSTRLVLSASRTGLPRLQS